MSTKLKLWFALAVALAVLGIGACAACGTWVLIRPGRMQAWLAATVAFFGYLCALSCIRSGFIIVRSLVRVRRLYQPERR